MLRNIEEELFERAPGKTASQEAPTVRDNWNLNREVLDLRRESADLRDDLQAARTLLAEQNVLTASSLSALREVGRDIERARADLAKMEENERALRAELQQEKIRLEDMRERLVSESAHREEMGNLLREAASAPAREEPQQAAEPKPAQEKPRRFVRRFF